jgi:hypothetical protein
MPSRHVGRFSLLQEHIALAFSALEKTSINIFFTTVRTSDLKKGSQLFTLISFHFLMEDFQRFSCLRYMGLMCFTWALFQLPS